MKSKLFVMVLAMMVVLSSGYVLAMGGDAGIGGHGAMMGGLGTFMAPGLPAQDYGSMSGSQDGIGQQGMTQNSNTSSEQSLGGTAHDHGVPSKAGAKGNPQFHQPHGGPPYCP